MTDLVITKKNEVFLTVEAEPYINQELADYFTFDVPGAKFMLNIVVSIGTVRSVFTLLLREKSMSVS